MTMTKLSALHISALTLATLTLAALSGCGLGTTATPSGPLSASAGIKGVVHGGQYPIYHAAINLYEAGYSGYGGSGAATLLATTFTDTGGYFQLTKNAGTGTPSGSPTATWECDSSNPNAQIYIIASGGNTQGTNTLTTTNTAAVFLAALGPCSGVSSSSQIVLNELSTAATVYSLAQYISPGTTAGTETIGTSSSTQGATGLNNAIAGIRNLAAYNGYMGSITPPTYTGTGSAAGITVTATADLPKLVLIANILAACVNTPASTSTSCADLFAAATPPNAAYTSQPSATLPTATDTLQAAYYLATNPALNGALAATCNDGGTTKAACLFALPTPGAPFTGALATAPTDYSLQVLYTSSNTCATGGSFIGDTYHGAVDASGNLWFTNSNGTSSTIGELSPIGQPLACLGGTATSPITFSTVVGITIDTAGNIWTAFDASAGGVVELPAASIPTATNSSLIKWPVPTPDPYMLAADGFGNVWANTNPTGAVYEWPNAAGTATPFTATIAVTGLDGTTGGLMRFLQVDPVGHVWTYASASDVYGVYPTTAATATVTGIATSATNSTATFTTSAANTFAVGNLVQLSGFTTATGQAFNHGTYTISAVPSSTSFTVTLPSAPATATATDSGIAILPAQTGVTSYASASNTVDSVNIYGLSIDSFGNLFTGVTCCGSGQPDRTPFKLITPTSLNSGTIPTVAEAPKTNFAGMNGSRSMVVDGANNVFVGNEYANSPGANATTGNFGINEFNAPTTGGTTTWTAITPTNTVTACSTSAGCASGSGFFHSQGNGITTLSWDMEIDPSGNLWYLNYGGAAITEAIGLAVPVSTPTALALKNNALATKP